MLSIDSQRKELEAKFGGDPTIDIVEVYEESYSAKAPGRPIFDQMIQRIQSGQAEGVIAWHPDRLARNAIDGGQIIHLLDCKRLKDLKFSTSSFENNPQGKFMLSIIFGYSKYYVDSLSENVKRGLRAKLDRGWQPNKPPTGYRNEPSLRTIVPDPEVLPVIERLFRSALTGLYSVSELQRMLRDQWGFRTPKSKRMGGRPLGLTSVTQILSNPFYTGHIRWKGQLYPGKHVAIITWREFQLLQTIIHLPDKRRPKSYTFPYTGLIRCGNCGNMITAENKINRHGSRYVYYHCTRKNRGVACREPAIEARDLERQIIHKLHALYVDPALVAQALSAVKHCALSREHSFESQRALLAKAIRACTERSKTLLDLRLRSLIDDEELVLRREEIQRERLGLTEELAALGQGLKWIEPVTLIISFCSRAANWFAAGSDAVRRLILISIGSNPTLTGKILNIDTVFPYSIGLKSLSFTGLCRVTWDVRTRYCKRDPCILSLLEHLEKLQRAIAEEQIAEQHLDAA